MQSLLVSSRTATAYLRTILTYMLLWVAAMSVLVFFRYWGHDLDSVFGELNFTLDFLFELALAIGAFVGFFYGILEIIFDLSHFRQLSYGKAMILRILANFCLFVTTLIFFNILFLRPLTIGRVLNAVLHFGANVELLLIMIYGFIVSFILSFMKLMSLRFGPGNLWRYIRGDFYDPKEENRIFMFIDLKASTSHAEKLGHIRYSRLLQDCFNDISVVDKYRAEIYQYVGDEVVLSWSLRDGLLDNNCIKAYYAFISRIEKNRDYYIDNYEIVPEFKAGMNGGIVTVAEVGEMKREIAFHGDTINTAARIQKVCNETNKRLLITSFLAEKLNPDNYLETERIGSFSLKGKMHEVDLVSINYDLERSIEGQIAPSSINTNIQSN